MTDRNRWPGRGIMAGLVLPATFCGITTLAAFGASHSLYFDGVNDYATFGQASGLGASNFTAECWFNRTGPGVSVSTGTGGITAIPLITKGRGEVDGNNKDLNFFLGIRASSTPVLVADFEEGAGGANPGLNHPVIGSTALISNKWYHAAVTYDGTNFSLYLNGALETNILVGQPPRWDSIQHAAVGSALNSSGAPSGYFKGYIDCPRVWREARSAENLCEIFDHDDLRQPGALQGQWNCNEGSGTTIADNSGQAIHGALVNGVGWADGVPTSSYLGIAAAAAAALTCTNPSRGYDFPNISANHHYINLENDSGGFGPTKYSLSLFTIETWFRREGDGNFVTIGDAWAGTYSAVPLIAKGGIGDAWDGTPERDLNYFLGIGRNAQGVWVLAADMEDGFGDNHPVLGVTEIKSLTWYHAAVTFDGSVLSLYLNGNLENAQSLPGVTPGTATLIQATVATVRNDNNQLFTTPANFQGKVDEIRLWDLARSAADIKADLGRELPPTANLVGYWRLNETTGMTANDSSGAGNHRAISQPSQGGNRWVAFNRPPFAPMPISPPAPEEGVVLSPGTAPTLAVTASDPDNSNLEVTFYGRPKYASTDTFWTDWWQNNPGRDFVLVALPDTQYYTGQTKGGSKAMFSRQIEWILNNRVASNIVYVTQLGDCAETPTPGEYQIAADDPATSDFGFYDLERNGVNLPYGIAVGNHDGTRIEVSPGNFVYDPLGNPLGSSSDFYNARFGTNHFANDPPYKPYYGGSWGDTNSTPAYAHNNDNHFDLFSASGLDFLVIYLEFNSRRLAAETFDHQAAIAWADRVLKTYPNRRAIVVSHSILSPSGNFSAQGNWIYDGLKSNPNLTLMLCGHECSSARRSDAFGGTTVHTLLSDYQCRTSDGGGGYLRIMEFSPSNNVIRVRTFSPYYAAITPNDPNDDYLQMPQDSFEIPYDLQHAPFKQIGQPKVLTSGGTVTSDAWTGLVPGVEYDWYAVVSDGCSTNPGPIRKFSTYFYPYYSWAQYENADAAAYSINSQGYFVGWWQQPAYPRYAVEWDAATPAIVTSLFDPAFTVMEGRGINDSRDLVGFSSVSGSDQAFAKITTAPFVSLGTPQSRAYRINNARTIVGYSTVGANIQASRWAWPNQQTSIVGPLPADTWSLALDVNDMAQGQADIVGESTSTTGAKRGFAFHESVGGAPQPLPYLDRYDQHSAQGVNNSGTIVGYSFRTGLPSRAVRWTKSGNPPTYAYSVAELAVPQGSPEGTSTYAFKISNTGIIVGAAYNPVWIGQASSGGWRAVVWHDDVGYYLDPIVDSVDRGFFALRSAYDVNDSGRIITDRLRSEFQPVSEAVVVGPVW